LGKAAQLKTIEIPVSLPPPVARDTNRPTDRRGYWDG
jgi:hypothetical protein